MHAGFGRGRSETCWRKSVRRRAPTLQERVVEHVVALSPRERTTTCDCRSSLHGERLGRGRGRVRVRGRVRGRSWGVADAVSPGTVRDDGCSPQVRDIPLAAPWHVVGEAHLFVAVLAPAYVPRRPTETVLYGLVRQHLETFLAHARDNYDGGLPRYVETELRAYLKCGVLSEGFTRAHCDACGHDLLVAFSCKSRAACPSCAGRRMANTGAAIVDRVLPNVPVRQYVLSLPFELRKLAAFKADVLTALGRIVVEAIFASYAVRARRSGLKDTQCGAINFVQRFGSSVNLHVHFHVVVLDGVVARDPDTGVVFHPAARPTRDELTAVVQRVWRRAEVWLRRHGYLDDRPLEDHSDESPAQTAIDACAAIAMGRGRTATLPNDEEPENDHESVSDGHSGSVDIDGFNLHAGVRVEAGDDAGREKLCRYAARPPLSLARLRRLPGGRVAYRLKYVGRGRGKHRIMEPMELIARLAALIPPPRYPLVRYAGVLGPRSAWREDVVPRPRERRPACNGASGGPHGADLAARLADPKTRGACLHRPDPGQRAPGPTCGDARPKGGEPERIRPAENCLAARSERPGPAASPSCRLDGSAAMVMRAPVVTALTPNVLSVRHWDRLLGGLLYAASPRIDWASLLRRTLHVDVLQCPKCHGRLRVLAVITERDPVTRILSHLGLPTRAPPLARSRDPSDELADIEPHAQLEARAGVGAGRGGPAREGATAMAGCAFGSGQRGPRYSLNVR